MPSPLLANVIGHFPMTEVSGAAINVVDMATNFAENGTIASISDGPGGRMARGNFGSSGGNNFEDDSQTLFNVAAGASTPTFTVVLWARFDIGSHSSQRWICGQDATADPGYYIRQNGGGGALFGTMRNQADTVNTDFGFAGSGLLQEDVWTIIMFGLDTTNDVIFSQWGDAANPPGTFSRDTVAKTDGIKMK